MMMFEIDTLAQYDDRLFLAEALARGQEIGKIEDRKADDIRQNIATLSHKLITMRAEDFSSGSELRKHVQAAFLLTSLGLEYGSKGNVEKATRLLNRNPIIKFFQIGNTLVDNLVERSKNTQQKAVLVAPETLMSFAAAQRIQVYNEWEHQFLEAVTEHKLVIDSPQVVLYQISSSRSMSCLADLTIANEQLDYIVARLKYLQTLPQEKIFAVDYPPNTDGDTAREITIALMVNLVLYRDVDFQLAPDDLDSFRDIAYDTKTKHIKDMFANRLIGWIGHYLDLTGQTDDVKKYAIAHWRECLKTLETECYREGTLEIADVLCP